MMRDLSLLSASAIAQALSFYVLLDGFDLGVGALLLTTKNETWRNTMVASVAPTWDGNETWLIMAAVALLGAFPIAYGVLLPAVYLPVLLMLMALGCRGVSFEFRVQPGARTGLWDRTFAWGSIVAALCQGIVVGAVLAGVDVVDGRFAGSVLDLLRPFPLLMGLVLLMGYVTLGAAWLAFRTTGAVRLHGQRWLRGLIPVFALFAVLAVAFAPAVQPQIGDRWELLGTPFLLLGLGFLLALVLAHRAIARGHDAAPFLYMVLAFVLALVGLVAVVYPDIVPFRLNLRDAASPTGSQLFLLVGIALVMPVVLAYSAFAYYVFRGKVSGHEE
jgi:cytochrome bd ubiquinol oxidase subunit II